MWRGKNEQKGAWEPTRQTAQISSYTLPQLQHLMTPSCEKFVACPLVLVLRELRVQASGEEEERRLFCTCVGGDLSLSL